MLGSAGSRLEGGILNSDLETSHRPWVRSTFFVKPCLKQHAFLVDLLGVSFDFLYTPTLMFLDPQKGRAQTKKGGSKSGSRIETSLPTEKGQREGRHSEF